MNPLWGNSQNVHLGGASHTNSVDEAERDSDGLLMGLWNFARPRSIFPNSDSHLATGCENLSLVLQLLYHKFGKTKRL